MWVPNGSNTTNNFIFRGIGIIIFIENTNLYVNIKIEKLYIPIDISKCAFTQKYIF